jgi:nucleotide-binding universal stress UspA family protein
MKILLAMDFSPASETALFAVACRPWPAGSSVQVLNVLETSGNTDEGDMEELTRRSEALVQGASGRLQAERIVAEPSIVRADPKEAIVGRAKRMGADFIFVGSHGKSGLARILLGSVAASVLRNAACSVEVVRAVPPPDRGMRILLGTDGSECSRLAAQSIAQRPWPRDTEVRILSVVEIALTTMQAAFEPPFVDAATLEGLRGSAMKRAQNAIAEAGQVLAAANLKTNEELSVLVDPVKEIMLDEAAQWGADLIVVGSHGRTGVDRLLMGSVSEAVALHAPCSVEVIRHKC